MENRALRNWVTSMLLQRTLISLNNEVKNRLYLIQKCNKLDVTDKERKRDSGYDRLLWS